MTEGLSLGSLSGALIVLLFLSGLFSMTETVMMACNRFRLNSLAQSGHRGAMLAVELLNKTDRLLGVILFFNNLINIAAATLSSLLTVELFGQKDSALAIGTIGLTFLILVFSEITPKVIGAHHADRLALIASYPLMFLLRITYPIVWFINLFVLGVLKLLHVDPSKKQEHTLTAKELRAMVLDSSRFMPQKNRDILANLFDLQNICVEDVMTPRGAIDSLDLRHSDDMLRQQLAHTNHTRLPVTEGDDERFIGILHVRQLLTHSLKTGIDISSIRSLVSDPYFIPADTPVYSQLQFFQENQQRIALVVDEYGELLGLISLEDILEELIGKFTTSVSDLSHTLHWEKEGYALVEGGQNLREINRQLGLDLPVEGPKTLNGLILEHLQLIPEAALSLCINSIVIEVMQTEDKRVRMARIFRHTF